MDNTSEIEKLKLDVSSIDEFLEKNRASIASATYDIMSIEKEDNSLRLLYIDVCELDDIREKIASTIKMKEDMKDVDEDTKSMLEQRIESLQNGLNSVVERLAKRGIKNREDYSNMLNAINAKKELIPNTKAEIKKKELEIVEMEERKKTILARIEDLRQQESEEKKEVTVDYKKQEESQNVIDNTKETSDKKKQTVSEIAVFIEYQNDDLENGERNKDNIREEKQKENNKKDDSLDSVIDKAVSKEKKVQDKFLEIIQENKQEDIAGEIQEFYNKFLEIVAKRLNESVQKLKGKRKFILKLEECANESTKEKEEQRLTNLNSDILNSIKDIEKEEQGLEGEIKYSFNEFSEYANNEFNYLCMLQSRIVDQLTEVRTKIDNIEKELGDIKGNKKESILELIENNQKAIDSTERKLKQLDSLIIEGAIELMNNTKERMSKADKYEDIKTILEELRIATIEKEKEMDSNKESIENEIKRLKNEKIALEERYNQKKDNEAEDIEKEALLLDSKNMLKDEMQKIIDMLGMLEVRNNEFKAKLDEDKRNIKEKIKQSDINIANKKKELMYNASEEMKPYDVRLFENVCEYNNEYTKEFDRYITKIIMDIDELKGENNKIRDKVNNVVVSSEFEENLVLLNELKESLDKILPINKLVDSVDKPEESDKTKYEQTIEESLSYIKPETTINDKINFSGIYEIEDKMQMVDELKKSITNMCERLEMNYGERQRKEKREKKVDKDKSHENVAGLEGYDDETREILMDVSWDHIEELKSMNVVYNKDLYLDDLKKIKDDKVMLIAKLKDDYQNAVEMARKLYELKKYVLAYKKGMEELAKGAKSNDKDDQKEYNKFMKVANKSLKTMQENGISSFEDFRNKVMKNSENVKQILAKTKTENEELVRLASLIKAIEIATKEHNESNSVVGVS